MRYRLAWIALLSLTPTSALIGWFAIPDGVSKAGFDRIALDMTEAEVEAIIGTRGITISTRTRGNVITEFRFWEDKHRSINVTFVDGLVHEKTFNSGCSAWQRFYDWYRGEWSQEPVPEVVSKGPLRSVLDRDQ